MSERIFIRDIVARKEVGYDGWTIGYSTTYHYDHGFLEGAMKIIPALEKYLNVKLDITQTDHNTRISYIPKDDAEEVFFILKLPTLNGTEIDI